MTNQTNPLYSCAMEVSAWDSSIKFESQQVSELLKNVAGFQLPEKLKTYWKHVDPNNEHNRFIHVYLAENIQEQQIALKFVLTDSKTEVYIKEALNPMPKESVLASVTDYIPITGEKSLPLPAQVAQSSPPAPSTLNTEDGLLRIKNWQKHNEIWIAYTLKQTKNLFFRGFRIPIVDIQSVLDQQNAPVYIMFGLKLITGQPEPIHFFDPALYTAELIVGTFTDSGTQPIVVDDKMLLADISTPVPPYNLSDPFNLL
ncbi:MAG: hypothetical protein ACPGJS_08945 [Flammeovirgaceae bacterium]